MQVRKGWIKADDFCLRVLIFVVLFVNNNLLSTIASYLSIDTIK